MNVKVIITGATGMVGEGVLHECLQHPGISEILVINRKSCGIVHPKLKEVLHADFFDVSAIEDKLQGYDTCFFCLGVSSIGMKEEVFTKFTYDLTIHVATTLLKQNPSMVFCYISGAGTDGSEKGRSMWARVKGKTENDLGKLGFKKIYNFRPGYMNPTAGLKNTLTYYKYVSWMFPVLKLIAGKYVSTLRELGLAMIHVATKGYPKKNLEVKDIVAAAAQEV